MSPNTAMQATNTRKKHRVPGLSGTCAGFCAAFFGKKPNQINDVPDVPGLSTTPFACVRAHASTHTGANFLPPHGCIPRHTRHIRHIFVFKRKNGKKPGTQPGTQFLNPAHASQLATNTTAMATTTIKTTPDNAKEVQHLVKNDPQLHALVQSLQAQGMFPGLRAVSFTLTGTPEHCAKGLQAWPEAAQAARTALKAPHVE